MPQQADIPNRDSDGGTLSVREARRSWEGGSEVTRARAEGGGHRRPGETQHLPEAHALCDDAGMPPRAVIILTALALTALALTACGDKPLPAATAEAPAVSDPTTLDAPPFPSDDPPPPPEPSYDPTFGDRVEREALYVVAPVAGGKRLQAASLRFDDGEVWIRSYRPVADELQFADKRVVVTGRPYTNSPYVQSVAGTHFELESIALAPGETPYDPPPTRIPAPPFVEDRASLEARVGLWAHCVGTLTALVPPDDDSPWWGRGVLTLGDGSAVSIDGIAWGDSPPTVEQGTDVTALALVLAPDEPGGTPSLGGNLKLCPGRVERCLMDDDWQRDDGRK